MLLTITYEGPKATDLGYLLYKNPSRPQTFELSYGHAHVFYPEATKDRCTAALLLDIDPIDLARGKRGNGGEGGLFDYVNDRPYVASSFLSTAISKVFGTAMKGKYKGKSELEGKELPLTATIAMLPCRGEENIVHELFEPLGYAVESESYSLDEKFPEWGASNYYTVSLSNVVKVSDLLNHLYVLIPVLDSTKHYWVDEEEIEKLLKHGEGWLSSHPKISLITARYLKRKKRLINMALERLLEDETETEKTEANDNQDATVLVAKKQNLNSQRLETVVSTLKSVNAKRVIDLGCGEGHLLTLLVKDRYFEQIAGTDVSFTALERAYDRLNLDRMSDAQKNRITLFQGSLTYRDKRFAGYDAAAVVEVIEHLDANRLSSLEKVLFKYARPQNVIVTTPNKEYNVHYELIQEEALRHKDHRFEWSRAEFISWATRVAETYGYSVTFHNIGDNDGTNGSPTQMGVFTL